MSAKEMFERLGYEYKFVNNEKNNCENVILYTHKETKLAVQFNLWGQIVGMQIKNKYKDYDVIGMFVTKELIHAINKQIEELEWN